MEAVDMAIATQWNIQLLGNIPKWVYDPSNAPYILTTIRPL